MFETYFGGWLAMTAAFFAAPAGLLAGKLDTLGVVATAGIVLFFAGILVAVVQPDFRLTLAPDEVAEVFEVPLRFLMTMENHQQQEREWRGRRRAFWAMPFGDRFIWGATAGMLKNMFDRLYAS